jgi:hypothetical protein
MDGFAVNQDLKSLLNWLWFGKFPLSIQDFRPRSIKTNPIVPTGRYRNAVRNLPIAAAELNVVRPVGFFFRSDVVQRVRTIGVLVEVSVRAVNGD